MTPVDAEAMTDALPGRAVRAARAGVIVAAAGLACALAATMAAGVPLRDPGAVSTSRFLVACGFVALFIALDVAVRARGRTGSRHALAAFATVLRRRWTRTRLGVVLLLATYSVSYFAYRNIKSVAPLLRPDDIFDRALLEIDRAVLGGSDPGAVLHAVLGTGVAGVLAAVYMAFFLFIPVALAAALVFPDDLRTSVFVATALAVTWLLGAASYVLLPAIGPFHADAATYAALPQTSVTDMQVRLMADRAAFLADPGAPGAAQSIGAFASLHTAFCGTVALAAHWLRAPRPVLAAAWGMTALTVLATVYFGWHYLLDDVAGAAIAVLALLLARALTGVDPRAPRPAPRSPTAPETARA